MGMQHRRLWRATALFQVALLLAGCLSTRTTTSRTADGEDGGVAVRIFADDDARRAGTPTDGIASRLDRRENGQWTPVFHSLDPRWTALGLPAGTYRLTFPERLDEHGETVKLDSKPQTIAVRKGQVTRVDATLSHVPKALIAAGVVVGVVAAVAIGKWLGDHDLLPPPPPPGVVEAVVDLSLEATFAERTERPGPGPRPVPSGPPPPLVTSHFPSQNATVAQPRVRITFSLSQPLDGAALAPDAVVVEAEHGGPVAGHVTYDPQRWWILWEPEEDLPKGDILHATLRPETVIGLRGDRLPAPATFTFWTR